jgi:peptidoglycan hydrolase CwlO-like protein
LKCPKTSTAIWLCRIGDLDQQFEQLNALIQQLKEENNELRNRLKGSNELFEKVRRWWT